MTLHISGECASSAVAFLDRVRQRLDKDRKAGELIRTREIELLKEFRRTKAASAQTSRPRCKPGESLQIALAAKKMLDEGKTRAEIRDALNLDDKLYRYHLEKNGMMPKKGTDLRFRVHSSFNLTPAMIATCNALRPHTSWEEIAGKLGVNRSTLINHYKAHRS